jgi:hypothetical protein
MGLQVAQSQPRVGYQSVEILHYDCLGDDRQVLENEPSACIYVSVEISIELRVANRMVDQGAQLPALKLLQLLPRPVIVHLELIQDHPGPCKIVQAFVTVSDSHRSASPGNVFQRLWFRLWGRA